MDCCPTDSNGETAFDRTRMEASICSLPMNLCLKRSPFSAGGYQVWSLEDIPLGVRFGPYQQTFIDVNKNDKEEDFEQQVQREIEDFVIVDDGQKELNWLPYVNYALLEEKSNMIIFRTESGLLYYVTCRQISANTQLLVYDSTAQGVKAFKVASGVVVKRYFVRWSEEEIVCVVFAIWIWIMIVDGPIMAI